MSSQMFDDGYGEYEVPSGERLTFKGGEGADATYDVPSIFDRAATPKKGGRSAAMGATDRFNSPGSYLRKAAGPGPGSYAPSPSKQPSSRYGTISAGELSPSGGRLRFEGKGEGADAVYSSTSEFGNQGIHKTGPSWSASDRFTSVGSYVRSTEGPGPGAYSTSRGVRESVERRAVSPISRERERLQFNPTSGMGESPGPAYKYESAFDKSSEHKGRASVNGFGRSDRFTSPGSYLRKYESPGPAAYTTQSNRARPASAPHHGHRAAQGRSVDFGPAGEGADPAYDVPSTFDKAAAKSSTTKPSSSFGTTSRFDKHGSYRAKTASGDPGPGSYVSPLHRKEESFARPRTQPISPNKDKGRVDFGPSGEGVAPIYNIKSSFDSPKSTRQKASSCFGTSNRFDGVGSYATPSLSPGPGAYSSRADAIKRSAPEAAFASPKMRPPGWRQSSARRSADLNRSSQSYVR